MGLTKDRLEQLIARSPDIVVATERAGTVVYYNDGASRILGYAADEVLGTFVGRLYPSLEEARRVMAAMRSPEHGGRDVVDTFRTTFLARSGEAIPVAISGTILRDEAGAEDGTIGFAKDLREILRREELATLGEVAIGLSHEINNPLAVILNQMELLERDVNRLAGDHDSSVEVERVDAVRREVARVGEILGRLEEMAKGDRYETVDYIGPARMIDLRRRRERARPPDRRLAGARILVADDDLGICRSLAEILEGEGCIVETAADGFEALRALEQGGFDALVSDVVMPKMDGYELFCEVRRRWPELPVVMMTAFHYDRDHVIKRSRLEGLEGVVFKKPIDPERLREVLAEVIHQPRG
jgi:PAS domain S-box-containing protein